MKFVNNKTEICVDKASHHPHFLDFMFDNAKMFGRIFKCDKILIKINIPYWETPIGSTTDKTSLFDLIMFLNPFQKPIFIVESRYNSTRTTTKRLYDIEPDMVMDLFERPSFNFPARTIDKRKLNLHVSTEPRDPKNFIITIGPPKTHEFVIYTGAVKTMMGFLKDKKRHMHGSNNLNIFSNTKTWSRMIECLHYNLRTLYMLTKTDIAILDGTSCMEGNGPVFGDHVNWDMWAISNDRHSLDYVVASLMGLHPSHIAYLYLIRGQAHVLDHFISDLMQEGLYREFKQPPRNTELFDISCRIIDNERNKYRIMSERYGK